MIFWELWFWVKTLTNTHTRQSKHSKKLSTPRRLRESTWQTRICNSQSANFLNSVRFSQNPTSTILYVRFIRKCRNLSTKSTTYTTTSTAGVRFLPSRQKTPLLKKENNTADCSPKLPKIRREKLKAQYLQIRKKQPSTQAAPQSVCKNLPCRLP